MSDLCSGSAPIAEYLVPGRRAHLVGIGGVSMCALAQVLHDQGMVITGSDMQRSAVTDRLERSGIHVFIGHDAAQVAGADLLIRTAAVHDDNPEIAAAHAAGIPVFERAQSWGQLMKKYPNAVCVAGTHGKTTTSSMVTHIFLAAGRDPTVMIGGYLPLLGAGHRVGQGDTIIMESCEYCNSFLNFYPTVPVILNIDADHLDFFKDLDDIKRSFRRFAELTPANGTVVLCGDDRNTMDAMAGLDRPTLTFGLGDGCDVTAANFQKGWSSFDILVHGALYCHVDLPLVGRHNCSNALAAAAAAWVLGVDGAAVAEGLNSFTGAGRRMEYKGTCNGAAVYDDYAHHPGELHALLSSIREKAPGKRVIAAFQPHTYSRTRALFDDFVRELQLADQVLVTEIYAAREKNTLGISAAALAERIEGALFCPTLDNLAAQLKAIATPDDVILTIGAGSISRVSDMILD